MNAKASSAISASYYEGGAPIVAPGPPEEQIPHQTYNMILFRCFDACILAFDNKTLDNQESHCVEECVQALKDPPQLFQRSHQFHGFLSPEELQLLSTRKARGLI